MPCDRRANVAVSAEAGDDKQMGEFELQTHMVNYEEKGTFDDFNEMAIQRVLRSIPPPIPWPVCKISPTAWNGTPMSESSPFEVQF